MKINLLDFIVRFKWRIAQTYIQITPIVGILNTFLYFLIFLGVNDIALSVIGTLGIFTIILLVFAIVGYVLDKIGYFRKDIAKTFNSATLDAYLIQAEWNALNIALYSKMSKEELEDMIINHRINKLK